MSCSLFMPPAMEEQKRDIEAGEFHKRVITRYAFLELWGQPTYQHIEQTQFYRRGDGNYVPSFRLEMGDAPPGWDGGMISDVAEFWIYPERGEVLGFVEDRLIYREQLATQRLHKLAKQWRYEQQFKTRLETPVPAP